MIEHKEGVVIELVIHKGSSDMVLETLLAGGKLGYFDFVYIDGLQSSA